MTLLSFNMILTFAILVTIYTFISQRTHLLMTLLALEASILLLAILWPLYMSSSSNMELFICLMILTLGAAEASLALSILVLISRTFGNNMMTILSINKC